MPTKLTKMADVYDKDFYLWATAQAAAIRSKRFELESLGIDWVNVAEELDTLGRSEKRELRRRLEVLLLHLLKWLHQPMHQGTSWRLTIEEQRDTVGEVLSLNPSLRPTLDQALKDAYGHAPAGGSRNRFRPQYISSGLSVGCRPGTQA